MGSGRKHCAASRENARRFHEDALRDILGLTDALSKLHALQGIPNEFEASARVKIAEVQDKLGLDSLDTHYTHVADAAKTVGLGDFFASNNRLLSSLSASDRGPCPGDYAPVGNPIPNLTSHADHFWTLFCWPMRDRIGRTGRHSHCLGVEYLRLGFPLITAASAHPTFVPTGLSISQLIRWLLCANATQQEQETDHSNRRSESLCTLLIRANK